MRPQAVVLSEETPGVAARRLARLLSHWGVRVRHAPLEVAGTPSPSRVANRDLLAIDAEAAARHLAARAGDASPAWLEDARLGNVLLFSAIPAEGMDRLVTEISGGALAGIRRLPEDTRTYDICADRPELAGSLSGVSVGPVAGTAEFAMEEGSGDGAHAVVRVNGRPLLVEVERAGGRLFVLAAGDVLDLGEETDRLNDAARFASFVPIVMVLRGLFADAVWHASDSFAAVVVDDPLLKRRYGSLEYERLLAEMDARDFTTEIAFIPFNRRRTSPRTARLFAERADRLGVCVHGCAHTRGEFASTDRDRLSATVSDARSKMEEHRLRAGLDYDDVMVFPQGRFSTVAMRVLGDGGFCAAVTSGPKATDDPREMTNGDFLDVAVRRYGGVPVFVRRATDDPGFLFDTFLGRPAILVSHPHDFGDGYAEVGRVVDELNRLDVRWATLGEIAEELNVQRRVASDRVHVHAACSRMVLRNDSDRRVTYLVVKSEPDRCPRRVRSSQGDLGFRRIGEKVYFEIELAPMSEETISLHFAEPPASGRPRRSPSEYGRILLRRRLSEARDRWLR